MNVTRVNTDHGSHIEPPLDEAWDDYTKLRWHAAVVAHDTGLTIEVREGGLSRLVDDEWQPVPGQYGVNVGRNSGGAYSYDTAWTFLVGVHIGAQEAQRHTNEGTGV